MPTLHAGPMFGLCLAVFGLCLANVQCRAYVWVPLVVGTHLGGSAVYWPEQTYPGVDNRDYLPFWGVKNQEIEGGCCFDANPQSANVAGAWRQEFDIHVAAPRKEPVAIRS